MSASEGVELASDVLNNNRNTRKRYEICSKLEQLEHQNSYNDIFLIFFLILTLSIIHSFFFRVFIIDFEQVNVSWHLLQVRLRFFFFTENSLAGFFLMKFFTKHYIKLNKNIIQAISIRVLHLGFIQYCNNICKLVLFKKSIVIFSTKIF